ncbi:MAG: hypothetical protein AAF543_05920 [Pseudomonadota bacterium]
MELFIAMRKSKASILWKTKLLATLNRSGEGALAVDIVTRIFDASIAVILPRLLVIGCDGRHIAAGLLFTSL